MKKVWLIADSVASPLGLTTKETYEKVSMGLSGLNPKTFNGLEVCVAQVSNLQANETFTRFESLSIAALNGLKKKIAIPPNRIIFILSTTKGNVEVLEKDQPQHPRIAPHAVAKMLASETGIAHHEVISNACTSGVVALLTAKRYVERGFVDHAVILGADALSQFVISGFQSLQALSSTTCKPFDKERSGINLGEAAAAVLLSGKPEEFDASTGIAFLGGGISNDANHISGPSKTGEELAGAIARALQEAQITPEEIDFISAHGTATRYNDEMESKAFHLAGLGNTPLHSLKGNFGHTLGAAGILETVMAAQGLCEQTLLPTFGFEKLGVPHPLKINVKKETAELRYALKTASGFGGCNAALVLEKIDSER
jgi:3-oxoacyl-[acyl-carrier-protein] synthase-1